MHFARGGGITILSRFFLRGLTILSRFFVRGLARPHDYEALLLAAPPPAPRTPAPIRAALCPHLNDKEMSQKDKKTDEFP